MKIDINLSFYVPSTMYCFLYLNRSMKNYHVKISGLMKCYGKFSQNIQPLPLFRSSRCKKSRFEPFSKVFFLHFCQSIKVCYELIVMTEKKYQIEKFLTLLFTFLCQKSLLDSNCFRNNNSFCIV